MNKSNGFRPKLDLGESFEKLKREKKLRPGMITINGLEIEILPGEKARWGNFTGTFTEVAKKVREAGIHLKNSIRQ